jgi:Mis12 protein
LEIENGLHQLETLLEATVDKAFDKFEIYVLRNILTVPEDLVGWIRLSHYEVCVLDICLCVALSAHSSLHQEQLVDLFVDFLRMGLPGIHGCSY